MLKDYYKVLNLPENAGIDEIKHAFRQLALQYHPDINLSPDAHEKFIEISHAYEYLMEKALYSQTEGQTIEYNFDQDWEEVFNEIRQEVKERARKQREIREEKARKQQEEFRKSGLYDLSLVARYLIHMLTIILAIGLIIFPIIIAITAELAAFFYLFYFWIVGLFLLIYVFSQRKTWFKFGEFYFKWEDILALIRYQNVNANQPCYYCNNKVADSFPHKHSMLIVKDIQLKNRGPLQHYAGYKRDYSTAIVPRSRKAFFVHFAASAIKFTCILLFMLFLPITSYMWRFVMGALAGGCLSSLLLLSMVTKSKITYLFNPVILIKAFIWLGLIVSLTKWDNILQFNTSEYMLVAVTLGIFFIDLAVDPFARLIFGKRFFRPLIKQPSQITELFLKGYQNNLEIPIWSTLYPLFRWIF